MAAGAVVVAVAAVAAAAVIGIATEARRFQGPAWSVGWSVARLCGATQSWACGLAGSDEFAGVEDTSWIQGVLDCSVHTTQFR
jgi:hypothetical protein